MWKSRAASMNSGNSTMAVYFATCVSPSVSALATASLQLPSRRKRQKKYRAMAIVPAA